MLDDVEDIDDGRVAEHDDLLINPPAISSYSASTAGSRRVGSPPSVLAVAARLEKGDANVRAIAPESGEAGRGRQQLKRGEVRGTYRLQHRAQPRQTTWDCRNEPAVDCGEAGTRSAHVGNPALQMVSLTNEEDPDALIRGLHFGGLEGERVGAATKDGGEVVEAGDQLGRQHTHLLVRRGAVLAKLQVHLMSRRASVRRPQSERWEMGFQKEWARGGVQKRVTGRAGAECTSC